MAIWSDRRSASSRKWVVKIIVRVPLSLSRILQSFWRARASTPLLHSSTQQTALPPVNIIANWSFRFWPPERFRDFDPSFLSISQAAMSSSISDFVAGSPVDLSLLKIRTCSNVVRLSHKTLRCGHIPNPPAPSTITEPSEIAFNPAMASSVVDFPLPLLPRIHTKFPWDIVKSRLSTATTISLVFPNRLAIFRAHHDGT